MKNSGVEWIGEIPEGWESIRLKYIYSTTKAKLPKQFYDDKNLTPYLSMDFIRDSINTEPVYAKDGDYCSEEDILILWDGSNAGEIVFNHPAGYAPSTTAILKKLSTQSLPVYDKFYLKALEDDLRRNTNGMGIPHVNGSYLSNSLFLLPPKSTQQRIATFLDKKCSKIEETIQNQQQVIEKLKAYKQSLITEAVTGKVKIENGKICGEYENYKDSGVEWIGKIPSEWETIKIKWLLNERKERSEEGKEEPLSMSQKYGLIPTKEMESIPNMASTFVGSKLTYKDDIVFNKLKAHLGVFSVSKYDGLVSPDYAVYTSTGKADLKYLEYLFKTPQCISEFRKRSTGVGEGLTRLYTGELFSIYIPFPEKKEQENIANILVSTCTAIDSAIEQKQNLIEKLTEYKKSLIYECVTGKKEI